MIYFQRESEQGTRGDGVVKVRILYDFGFISHSH